MLIKALESQRKMLVVRKVTATLRDSIFAEFQSAISKFGLYDKCKIVSSLLTIELPNGSQLIFKGMDDPEKIKSIAGIDDIIIEEATELTVDDYSQLQLRLRSNRPNNQVILMYNPVSKANWVYKMFHENGCPDNCRVIHTTWKDNKFLPQSYIDNLMQMAKLKVPVIAIITGEGCSGGALGLAVANKVLVLEHAYYTVISPEGCASILWRDAAKAPEAAEALKITGPDLLKYNIIDGIVKEPLGGAHYDYEAMGEELKKEILKAIDEYKDMTPQQLKDDRYSKFRRMGVFNA